MNKLILDWRSDIDGRQYTAVVGQNQMICNVVSGDCGEWLWSVYLIARDKGGYGVTKHLLANNEADSLKEAQAQAEAFAQVWALGVAMPFMQLPEVTE